MNVNAEWSAEDVCLATEIILKERRIIRIWLYYKIFDRIIDYKHDCPLQVIIIKG